MFSLLKKRDSRSVWKTMGITTRSRIWVTVDVAAHQNAKSLIYGLNSGQSHATQVAAKLSKSYGRNFLRLRKVFVIVIAALAINWAWMAFRLFVHSVYCFLSVTDARLILGLAFSGFCVCIVRWAVVSYSVPAGAPLWALSTFAFGSFCLVFSRMKLVLDAVQIEKKDEETFADLWPLIREPRLRPRPFLEEKRFLRKSYDLLAKLSRLEGKKLLVPDVYLAEVGFTQQPDALFNLKKLSVYKMITRLPALQKWPTLSEYLTAQTTLRALHLYQWQSLHKYNPAKLRQEPSLWGKRRLAMPRFRSTAVAQTLQELTVSPTTTGNVQELLAWLPPLPQLTTYVYDTNRLPVRYDYLQNLRMSEAVSWNKFKGVGAKVKLRRRVRK